MQIAMDLESRYGSTSIATLMSCKNWLCVLIYCDFICIFVQYIKKACMAEYELTEAQNDAIREKTQELVGLCVRGFY